MYYSSASRHFFADPLVILIALVYMGLSCNHGDLLNPLILIFKSDMGMDLLMPTPNPSNLKWERHRELPPLRAISAVFKLDKKSSILRLHAHRDITMVTPKSPKPHGCRDVPMLTRRSPNCQLRDILLLILKLQISNPHS